MLNSIPGVRQAEGLILTGDLTNRGRADKARSVLEHAKSVNKNLLARAHITFISDFNGWHIEFAAAEPQLSEIGGEHAIRLKFPDIISSQQQRRTEPRAPIANRLPLHCEADQQGIMTFDGELVDISHGGIGFVTYDSGITLEPGTVLKGTRIQRPGKPTLIVDLEVRYSKPVLLANGQGAHRSGCVFLNPTREIAELIESFSEKRGSRKD